MNELIQTNLSPSLSSSLKVAKSLADQDGHQQYGVAHLALALLKEPTGLKAILGSINKDVVYIEEWFEMRKEVYTSVPSQIDNKIEPDKEVQKIFEESERSQIKLGTDSIDAVCVFLAIIREGVVYNNQQLNTLEIKEKELLTLYDTPIGFHRIDTKSEFNEVVNNTIPFCESLVNQENKEEGSLIVGRDKVVRTILENLERKELTGILIVGDSGVGKTSIVKGLIYYLSESKNPEFNEMNVIGLNASKLLASITNPHEISKKLNEVFDKVRKLNNTLFVIDDLNILLGAAAGAATTISHLITSEIVSNNLNLIATTSTDSYRKNIESTTLNRKAEIIRLEELDNDFVLECLEKHRYRLTDHYQLKIADTAINESIQHSKRYFKENKLPYAAINLLDRTMASSVLSNRNTFREIIKIKEEFDSLIQDEDYLQSIKILYKTLMELVDPITLNQVTNDFNLLKLESTNDANNAFGALLIELETIASEKIEEITDLEVASITASITGIPLGKIQAEEKERLLNIENKLQNRVKGQNHAINTLSDAIIESRSGLSNPKQPIGSFFFLGPTGTGKTELTKSLAELLFDDESAMIRFDMSEFKEEHSAALLYGAPPGYVGYEEGGMLVNKIRQKPYSIVLFDEIEKAHSSVYDVFLQIMDEGVIHDKLGRDGDFSNSIIIFTSNIGSQWIAEEFEKGNKPESTKLIEIMAPHFRPEFLGRLTEVIPFAPINLDVAKMIFNLHIKKLQDQLLKQKNITLELTDEALEMLSNKGYSKQYGARPIAGVIRTYVKKVISRMIVAETVKEGDKVVLKYENDGLVWEKG